MPKVLVKNVLLRVDDVVVIGAASEAPCFCKIRDIVSFEGQVFLKCQLQTTTSYMERANVFVGSDTLHETIFTPESLLLPWPVFWYSKEGSVYHIPQCISSCSHIEAVW